MQEDVYKITEKDRQIRETTLILFVETLAGVPCFPGKQGQAPEHLLFGKGIETEDIKAYVQALAEILPKNRYFTYDSLLKEKYYRKHPALEKIEKMGLEKELLINFIRNVPGIKKTTKGNLFRISKKQSTVDDFVAQVFKETGFTNEELKNYIWDHYRFKVR